MFDTISNITVRKALNAINSGSQVAFKELLAPNVRFIHNGEEDDIHQWAADHFFKNGATRFIGLKATENNDTVVYARLAFDHMTEVDVKFQFTIIDGRIAALNAGRP